MRNRLFQTAVVVLSLVVAGAVPTAAQEPGSVVASDSRVQGRTYTFAGTGKEVPYALFVPSAYDAAQEWPLIVTLHGLGRPYDWMMGYEGAIDLAERDGYIMVSPLGYHPRAWYGSRGSGIPQMRRAENDTEALPENLGELSERDVMNVFEIVRQEFSIDEDRMYLWGHSMGGAGTYHLAAKHPDLWAAVGVAAPAPSASIDQLKAFKHVPIIVLQGDQDRLVKTTREWVAKMKALGMEHVYVEVKDGDHSRFINASSETLGKIFAFFNIVRKDQRPELSAFSAAAQTVPRTAWGHPDLGGIWDYRTITPLERPEERADQEVLTEEEAASLERGAVERDRSADTAPARRTEAGGNVGAYNRFWLDFGTTVVGDRRTSLIIDPPTGRKPAVTAEVQARRAASSGGARRRPASWEDMSLFDRCIGTAGLPIHPVAYNNNVHLFQTPDLVVMLSEWMNSVRFIPLDGRPHGTLPQGLGDSRGRWEGDTLVVETTNFGRRLMLIGSSPNPQRLVERFTRVSPDFIEYEYTIEDPDMWTRPWTAVLPLKKSEALLYEYACHEGNYAMGNILGGARAEELAAAADAAPGAR